MHNQNDQNNQDHPQDAKQLLEELKIYQSELEMQNNELRQREYELNSLLEKYNSLYNSAPVGYLTLDENMIITEINRMGCDLLGEAKRKILTRDFTSLIDSNSQDNFYLFIKRLERVYANHSVEIQLKTLKSVTKHFQLSGSIGTFDNNKSYRITISDISQLKKYEYELKRINQNLEKLVSKRTEELQKEINNHRQTVEELKESQESLQKERELLTDRVLERTSSLRRTNEELRLAVKAKDEFLANMSHELRTPLNAILGLSESLEKHLADRLSERETDALSTINKSGVHLLNLINDILDLSKLESGNIELNYSQVPLYQIATTSLLFIRQQAKKKDIRVHEEISDNHIEVNTDPKRVKQIIVNLLKNAVKFTPRGKEIGLKANFDYVKNEIQFVVWDKGIGIDSSKLDTLFKPFVQLDTGTSKQYEGPGLGLSLVKSLTEKLKGTITVESQPSIGSSFKVCLPANIYNDKREHNNSQDKEEIEPEISERKKLLLAEDNENNILTIKLQLKSQNYEIITAINGRQAIEKAKSEHPDIILMDIQMPGMDGLEAIERLRKDSQFDKTPIIAMTAFTDRSDMDKSLKAGADDYITKPVSSDKLKKVIRKSMNAKD